MILREKFRRFKVREKAMLKKNYLKSNHFQMQVLIQRTQVKHVLNKTF